MSGLMKHGMAKCNKQHYKLSGAQYATPIDETPRSSYLVRSRLGTQQNEMFVNMARGEAYEKLPI